MKVAANSSIERSVACYNAFKANPQLQQFMPPNLLQRLKALATRGAYLLAIVADDKRMKQVQDEVQAVYRATRRLLQHLQLGIKFVFFDRPEVLKGFGRLTLGDDPTQDLIRLKNLLHDVQRQPDAEALWRPALTAEIITAQIAKHEDAVKVETADDQDVQAALRELRVLRPQADALWEEGLDTWVQTFIADHEEQIAWGRERKKRARAAAETETTENRTPAEPLIHGKSTPDVRPVVLSAPVLTAQPAVPKPVVSNGHSVASTLIESGAQD